MARVLVALVVLAAAGTVAQAAQAQPTTALPVAAVGGTGKAAASFTAKIARSDETLLDLTGTKPVNVMVRLDYDPVASYLGGIQGLAATSPEATHQPLAANRAAVAAYQDHLAMFDNRVLASIRTTIPEARILGVHHVAFGGVSVRLPADRVRDLLAIDGVVAVMQNKLATPQTNVTPKFVGATDVWPLVGGPVHAGEDVLIGELDTGVWPEHGSFQDQGIPPAKGSYRCQFGDGTDPDLGPPFRCNDKLVGAYAFLDTYTSILGPEPGEFCDLDAAPGQPANCSARDSEGHGTHALSTVGGGVNPKAETLGIPRGTIAGMAPGARLVSYRVCLSRGCFSDDMVSAVEQAIVDGIDVLNVPIGPFGPAFSDPVALAFLDAYAAGITVTVAAGNGGPAARTASDPGPWTIVVGASTSPRQYASPLFVASSDGSSFAAVGNTITAGIAGPTAVVDAEDVVGYHDAMCRTPLPRESVTDKVVACERGANARVQKSHNVLRGGAAGMILWNALPNQDVGTDNHWVPTIQLGGRDGISFKDFIDRHPNSTATWEPGTPALWKSDVTAAFSSRGPVGDFLKPDITAPGVQILAAMTPRPKANPDIPQVGGASYQAVTGTSTSSAHVAGAAALIQAIHPSWSPAQIKSVLVSSGDRSGTFKEDGVTAADPFDVGGGSLRVGPASKAQLALDVPARQFFALANDATHRVDLNTPSIDLSAPAAVVTTVRSFRNVTDRTVRYEVRTSTDGSAAVTADPKEFTLAPGQTQDITVTIDATTSTDGMHFGRLDLIPLGPDRGQRPPTQSLAIAFFHRLTSTAIPNGCDETFVAIGRSGPCPSSPTNPPRLHASLSE